MQELWAIKIGWDERLSHPQSDRWDRLLESLSGLDMITIPRWIRTRSDSVKEIHGFCDASRLAMAAVVFVKTGTSGNHINISLLCSKTKVAPLNRMTIPRLELTSAVMLTKLMVHCLKTLNYENTPCYLWTDSSMVQTWLNNHPSRWKDFVHNRICFIHEALPQATWNHIQGHINPADCATRGLNASDLKSHAIWWSGPPWLIQEHSTWPTSLPHENHSSIELEETSNSQPVILHSAPVLKPWNLLTRYSNLTRLFRITAVCIRISQLVLNKPANQLKSPLTPEELETATYFWIKYTQRDYFNQEIKLISNHNDISKSSSIYRLLPFIDHHGCLRVGGRLSNSTLPYSTKHPYILPRKSILTTLIIRHAHYQTLHGSTQDTLNYIRNEYWIVGGRAPVRSFILRCVTCTRYRRTQAQQLMGQLPPPRVTPSRPFLNSGVDYAGPVMSKTWNARAPRLYKAWIALFVCYSTSAIHLEIVTDYSTAAFISAYKRFISRRGICATLFSDCGTNFKGADSALQKLFNANSNELQNLASLIASDGTKWLFNPPAAPHFGGKFEAGVKSMKHHLRRVIGETKLTYEELSTVLTQVEAILNSRPLCPLTEDPADLSVLTPAHFLVGHSLTLVPETNLEHLHSTRLSRWQRLTQMVQSFWTQWSREYLQRQQSVYKWNQSTNPITEGSVVLIVDERYPPAKWPLGRVVKVYPGKDNIVGVVDVKTSSAILHRSITKLCLLPVGSDSEESSLPESSMAGGNV